MHYADTYALIEVLRGNPNYRPYTTLVTSEFNLLELAYALVRDHGKGKTLKVLEEVRREVIIVHPTDEDYIEASNFRLDQRRLGRNVSLIDALGYTIANKLGIPFLTGDSAFKDLDNVEYVK